MIGVIDYGMGNLHSVLKALEHVGAEARIVTKAAEIDGADKVILPGVGAFAEAMGTLRERGLVEAIGRAAADGRGFLGICLGLQLLFDVSYEDGEHRGLGLIAGKVVRFDFGGRVGAGEWKIPHMGWNALRMRRRAAIYRDVPEGAYVYFVHSYHVAPEDDGVIATVTDHGGEFVSSIARGNLFATQFHPEKSQQVGLQILRNFSEL